MSDLIAPLSLAVSIVLMTAIVCGAALAAWRGWLDLKRLELGRRMSEHPEPQVEPDTGALIELAAMKERLRRLEAIASGVEL